MNNKGDNLARNNGAARGEGAGGQDNGLHECTSEPRIKTWSSNNG